MSTNPARRPATDAKVGDIVQSKSGSSHALWKVEAARDVPYYGRSETRKLLTLRGLNSNRMEYDRAASWMDILSPEEVARIQAKRAPKALPVEALEAIKTLTIERDALRAQRDELTQRILNEGAVSREPADGLNIIRPLLIDALRAAKFDLPNLEYDFPDSLSVEGDDIEFRLTIGAL